MSEGDWYSEKKKKGRLESPAILSQMDKERGHWSQDVERFEWLGERPRVGAVRGEPGAGGMECVWGVGSKRWGLRGRRKGADGGCEAVLTFTLSEVGRHCRVPSRGMTSSEEGSRGHHSGSIFIDWAVNRGGVGEGRKNGGQRLILYAM